MLRFWKDLKGHYRYAIFSAKASLKSEVASSYLNWIWWILEPFCFMLIYAFIFGVVFNAKEPHFGVFIFIGLTAWNFFSRCLTQSVKILRVNKSIVTKVYIPKFVLLISRMFFNGYKMLISFGIIAVMLVYYRIPLTLNIFYLPLVFLVHCVITFACMTFLIIYVLSDIFDLSETVPALAHPAAVSHSGSPLPAILIFCTGFPFLIKKD